MANYKYKSQLKDPRWQKKRLEVMDRDEWKCRLCHNDESELQVHHRYYTAGNDVWDYPDDALITLCGECHSAEHNYTKDLNERLIELKTSFGEAGLSNKLLNYFIVNLTTLIQNSDTDGYNEALLFIDSITKNEQTFRDKEIINKLKDR